MYNQQNYVTAEDFHHSKRDPLHISGHFIFPPRMLPSEILKLPTDLSMRLFPSVWKPLLF